MKIFNQSKGFEEKVNFVDENNVVLGYSLSQDCCERFGWFIKDKPISENLERCFDYPEALEGIIDYPGWTFDTKFFEETTDKDELDIAIFRIVKGKKKKYIHLFNSHNGYYYHGFEFSVNNNTLKKGKL